MRSRRLALLAVAGLGLAGTVRPGPAGLIAGTHGSTTGDRHPSPTPTAPRSRSRSSTDWAYGTPVSGDDLLSTTAHRNPDGPGAHQVSVYGTTVPIDPAKTVAEVTLP
jgi:hypothetical protein